MPVFLPGAKASSRLLGSREISPEHTRECAQWHGTSGGIDRGRLRCLRGHALTVALQDQGLGLKIVTKTVCVCWGREGGGGRLSHNADNVASEFCMLETNVFYTLKNIYYRYN